MTQPTVFISYSHQDEQEKQVLLSHLGVLQHAGLIDLWSDDRIKAGADWEQEISQAIAQAKVAILLISANFLTSDFILKNEVPTLLKRRQSEGLTVFPVLAKACAWRTVTWLSQINVRPRNGRPVWDDGGSHVDADMAEIAEEVAAILRSSYNTEPKPDQPSEVFSPTRDLLKGETREHLTLPAELLEEYSRGNVVLFCGEEIAVGEGEVPSRAELAEALAKEADLGDVSGRGLPVVAQAYTGKMGYQRLIAKMTQMIKQDRPYRPLSTHHLIASLNFKYIVTTNWDELLEKAFDEANQAYVKVVGDHDVAFVDEQQTCLIKLHGSIENRTSIVITEDEYLNLFANWPAKTNMVRDLVARKTVLFLGFDLSDQDFKQLFNQVRRDLNQFQRRAYAVQPNLDQISKMDYERKGVEIIKADITKFLRAFGKCLRVETTK